MSMPRGWDQALAARTRREDMIDVLEREHDEPQQVCPECMGEPKLIAKIGRMSWFECRECGWVFNDAQALLEER